MERTTCCFAGQTAMIGSVRPLAVDAVVWTLTSRAMNRTDHLMLLLLHTQTTMIRSARPVAAAVFLDIDVQGQEKNGPFDVVAVQTAMIRSARPVAAVVWTLTSRAMNRTDHLMLLLSRQR